MLPEIIRRQKSESFLHPLVKVFTRFQMAKIWEHQMIKVQQIFFCPLPISKELVATTLKSIQISCIKNCGVTYDSNCFEPIPIDFFRASEKLLKIFFSSGVTLKKITRPLSNLLEFINPIPRLLLRATFKGLVTNLSKETLGNI